MALLRTIYHISIALLVLCLLFVSVFGVLYLLLEGMLAYFWNVDLLDQLVEWTGFDLEQYLP